MASNMTPEAKPDLKVQVARSTAREKIKAFNVEGVAEKITRPMLVIAAREDRITRGQDGERLSREVSGPVKF
ncbi:MAG: hypothetical protein O7B35_16860 [Deltaproteobacteria bacterium]|nr:hypothetical protein [Deltaproteobacteria bacterium]